MNEQTNEDRRKELLDSLEKSFGSYHLNGYVYQFDKFDQRDIALAIGADPSSLNRLLNQNVSKKNQTFDRYLVMSENYAKANENRNRSEKVISSRNAKSFQVKNKISCLALIILTSTILILWHLDRKQLTRNIDAYKQDIHVSYADFPDIYISASSANPIKLAQLAVLQNLKIKSDCTLDTLAIIKECKDQVRSTIIDTRRSSILSRVIMPNGQRLLSLIEEVNPNDKLYMCTDSVLAYATKYPDHATLFDKGLMDLRKVVFNKDIYLSELIRLVEREINSVQHDQINNILRKCINE